MNRHSNRLQAKLASKSGGDAAVLSLHYHTY